MSSPELDSWFAAAPPAQQAILAKLRALVKSSAPGAVDERAARALLEQAARL